MIRSVRKYPQNKHCNRESGNFQFINYQEILFKEYVNA